MPVASIREQVGIEGRSPGAGRFDRLNAPAAARAAMALVRLERNNLSSVKGVGGDVSEYGIDFGPGCRIHFGKDGMR